MIWTGRIISLMWALWWIFFGLASAFGEGLSPAGISIHSLLPGGLFMASAVISWRWMALGGILLCVEGLILAVGYPIITFKTFPVSTILFVEFTMALPALVAGIIFIILHIKKTQKRAENGANHSV